MLFLFEIWIMFIVLIKLIYYKFVKYKVIKISVNIDDVKEWKVFRVLFLDMDRGK